MNKRNEVLMQEISNNNIDAFFVTATPNIRYITGFTGEDAYLLITSKNIYLIVDSRFTVQAEEEVFENIEVIEYKPPLTKFLKTLFAKHGIHWLGIEKNRLVTSLYITLSQTGFLHIVPVENLVEKMRMVKEPDEIEIIKKACEISSKSFNETLKFIKAGITEKDVAAELEYRFKKNGADKTSFDTIIAAGERGALPHGMPTERKIRVNELIVMDFGVFYNGYASDTTRTVSVGEPDSKSKEVYKIVREAQELGRSLVEEGISCRELDKKVRKYINDAGYGKYFIHGLGHGVGLEIHELPYVNSRSDIILKEGMIITVEPGIYLPGEFGVRIEDTILVTKAGGEVLTDLTHEPIVL